MDHITTMQNACLNEWATEKSKTTFASNPDGSINYLYLDGHFLSSVRERLRRKYGDVIVNSISKKMK